MKTQQNWTWIVLKNDPGSSECVEIHLKTVDYSEQPLTSMDDQCLAWLHTKMSCFSTVSGPLCVMLLMCHVREHLSKMPVAFPACA